jgi:hypothetical protein
LGDEQVTFDHDWALLGAVDGRRPISALARRLDLGFSAAASLKALIEAGAIELAPEPERIAHRSTLPKSATPARTHSSASHTRRRRESTRRPELSIKPSPPGHAAFLMAG